MKYKARYNRYERLSDDEILHILLKERGVENPTSFLQLSDKDLCNPREFKNMQKGLDMLYKHLDRNSIIAILVDQDCDGYTSSAFTYLELKQLNPQCELKYIIHKGKTHGIEFSEIEEQTNFEFDLLIIPDASSSDEKQCKKLNELNKDILILDHHNFTEDFTNERTVIINCQDGSYKNTTLSGVGVVYKFFNFYEELTDSKYYSNGLLDLVAIGMVGDIMDIRNYETRLLCLKGMEVFNSGNGNSFIREIVKKGEKRIGNKLTFKVIGWNIVPLINAVAREGSLQDKEDVFKALINSNEKRMYQPRRKHKGDPKPEPIEQTLQEFMAREITNIKARQDKKVKKQTQGILDIIERDKLFFNKIIMVNVTSMLDSSFTGYVANQIAKYYKRPVLLFREKGDSNFGGSGRNYDKFAIDNLRQYLLDTELFNSCAGHDNAFGIDIPYYNIEVLQQTLNKNLKDVAIEDIYHVDYAIPIGRLRQKHILQIGQFENMWGGTLQEPLFAITDIFVDLADIQLLGERQNVLSITKETNNGRIKFISLQNAKEMYSQITGKSNKGLKSKKSSKIGLDIIGKFKINNFNNNEYPQIEIVDYNIIGEKTIKF